MKAKDIMTREVITVKEEDTIEEVVKLILEHRISGVPVINDENEIVGIISEADLIYREKDISIPTFIPLFEGFILLDSVKKFEDKLRKKAAYKAKNAMTSPAITVNQNEDVHRIANIMLNKRINRVPVTDDEGKLVGIITRSNILSSIEGVE